MGSAENGNRGVKNIYLFQGPGVNFIGKTIRLLLLYRL